jgi:hypothetical protein
MKRNGPVFMEFGMTYPFEGKRAYFVGSSEAAIVFDAFCGDFDGMVFQGHRTVYRSEVESLGFDCLHDGISSIESGVSNSYYLGRRSIK